MVRNDSKPTPSWVAARIVKPGVHCTVCRQFTGTRILISPRSVGLNLFQAAMLVSAASRKLV